MRSVQRLSSLLVLLPFSGTASPRWWNRLKSRNQEEGMGQIVRVMRYDRAGNEAAAIQALNLLGEGLNWFRLDDGVMGGQSETVHSNDSGGLHFKGTINTDGGGFCSIRARLPQCFQPGITGFKLKFIGDGKTYKLTLSDGNASTGGPFSRTPSWQVDLPTQAGTEQTAVLHLCEMKPAFGGRASSRPSDDDITSYVLDITGIREIGLMLSLKLSDGSPNPKETFGEGIFPFSLQVLSIEPVMEDT